MNQNTKIKVSKKWNTCIQMIKWKNLILQWDNRDLPVFDHRVFIICVLHMIKCSICWLLLIIWYSTVYGHALASTNPTKNILQLKKRIQKYSFRSNLIMLFSLFPNGTGFSLFWCISVGLIVKVRISVRDPPNSSDHFTDFASLGTTWSVWSEYDQTLYDHLMFDLSILYGYLKQMSHFWIKIRWDTFVAVPLL